MKTHWPSGRRKLSSSRGRIAPAPRINRLPAVPKDDANVGSTTELKDALGRDERGIIVSCPIEVEGDQITVIKNRLDQQDLRTALLFWDRIDWPVNNAINIVDHSVEYLVSEGVIVRSMVTCDLTQITGIAFAQSSADLFNAREKQSPGQWALSQGTNSISVSDTLLPSNGRGLWCELVKAIPVPHADVAYSDVLEFRSRRRDELLNLRNEIDQLYQEILVAPDRPLAETSAFSRIDKATKALREVTAETGFQAVWTSLKSRLDGDLFADEVAKPILEESLKGGLFGAFTGDVWAAMGAGLSVGVGKAFLRKGQKPTTPYEYAYSFHKDLNWVR